MRQKCAYCFKDLYRNIFVSPNVSYKFGDGQEVRRKYCCEDHWKKDQYERWAAARKRHG